MSKTEQRFALVQRTAAAIDERVKRFRAAWVRSPEPFVPSRRTMEEKMETPELETRLGVMAARIGALELLLETLLGREIADDAGFRGAIDEMADPDAIRKDLHLVKDAFMKDRLLLIQQLLSERVQGAHRQAERFG